MSEETTQVAAEATATVERTETFPQDVKAADAATTPEVTATETPAVDTTQVETKADVPETKPDEKTETKPAEELSLKVPENSFVTEERVKELTKLAKDNGLTNEQAQSLVNVEHDSIVRFQQAQVAEFERLSKNVWVEDLKKDPEFGGEKFNETVALSNRVAKQYAPEALMKELEKGYGNYPDLAKMLARIGKDMESSKFVPAGSAAKTPVSTAEKWYGKDQ